MHPLLNPFDFPDRKFPKLDIPNDIKDKIDSMELIKRGQNPKYPVGMIVDNDKAHTIRMIRRVSLLDLDSELYRYIERMLWVHDIPEIETMDITSTEKELSGLNTDHTEDAVAKSLLSKKDYVLFNEFNRAKYLLEGKVMLSEVVIPPEPAFIARVLDITDGNMGFYYSFPLWMNSEKYSISHVWPDNLFSFALRQFLLYKENIKSLPVAEKYKEILIDLLEKQLCYIVRQIDLISDDKLSADMLKNRDAMRKIVSCQ
jgi:hypothetical protein